MQSGELSLDYFGNKLVGQSDLELVAAARAGSDAAFAEMHRLYAHRLYRTIVSITKSYEDAEDVLQETFMRAYLALDSFEGRSKLYSWLTRIAINTSLMALRKRRVRRETNFESLSCSENEVLQLQIKDPNPDPEEFCLQLERCRRTVNAIAELRPPLRMVLEIQMSRECSLKEIARSLDVPVTTVKARLYRARKRLAKRTQSGTRILPPRAGTARRIRQSSDDGSGDNY